MDTPKLDRVPHWLTSNEGTWIPSQVVTVETTPVRTADPDDWNSEIHTLGFATAFYRRTRGGKNAGEWLAFAEPMDFWDWCLAKPRKGSSLWIAGHGLLYHLTLLKFWGLLDSGEITLETRMDRRQLGWDGKRDDDKLATPMCVLNDPPTIILCRFRGTLLTLVDTRNYWDVPLEDLARDMAVPQPARPSDDAGEAAWVAYLSARCRAAADGLVELMKWWQGADLGSWRFTASSLSWHAFRHRWVGTPKQKVRKIKEGGERRKWAWERVSILIDNDQDAAELGRRAVAAGECRVFRAGPVGGGPILTGHKGAGKLPPKLVPPAGPVYVLDVAGFYASIMRDNYFPCELVGVVDGAQVADLTHWDQYLCQLADCTIETTERVYPARHNGERVWALGRFETTLAGPELLQAARLGDLRRVGRIALYRRHRLFTAFVDHFWALRQDYRKAGNTAHEAFAKLVLVSLSGRWAQRQAKWEDTAERSEVHRWGHFPSIDLDADLLTPCRSLAGHVQKQTRQGETENSFPAITAMIHSYGRVRMAELRAVAGEANVYYQATDSLHCNVHAVKKLMLAGELVPNTLGKFDIRARVGEAEYRGPMDYSVGGAHVVSGLRPDAEEVGRGVYRSLAFEGFDALTMRGPRSHVVMRVERRRLGPLHVQGCLHPDGRVTPPVLSEGELVTHPKKAAEILARMAGSHRPGDLLGPGSGSTSPGPPAEA